MKNLTVYSLVLFLNFSNLQAVTFDQTQSISPQDFLENENFQMYDASENHCLFYKGKIEERKISIYGLKSLKICTLGFYKSSIELNTLTSSFSDALSAYRKRSSCWSAGGERIRAINPTNNRSEYFCAFHDQSFIEERTLQSGYGNGRNCELDRAIRSDPPYYKDCSD